jgi:glucan phosphoethanolaminetransferase (alkaline phosphatase superfamily)
MRESSAHDRVPAAVRRYLILLSALFAAVAAVLVAYQQMLALDSLVVLFGLSWPFAACLLAWLVAMLVGRNWASPGDRVSARVLAVGLFLILAVFVLIYASNAISNALWGDTLDYEMVFASLPQLRLLFEHNLFGPEQRLFVEAAAAVAVLLFLVFAAWFSRALAVSTMASARHWLEERPGRRPETLVWSVAAIFAAALSACVLMATHDRDLAGDPLTGFFKISGGTTALALEGARLEALHADNASLDAYPSDIPFDKKNVILIFADSTRADHMGVYGYGRQTTPSLSALQQEGRLVRVETALSTCSDSFCGIASTFASHPLHEISAGSLKLSTLLRRQGYRIHFYLSGNHRTWRYIEDFYGPDIDERHEGSAYETDILDDRYIIRSLETLPPANGTPHFFYFFLMSSHSAGTKLDEYRHYLPDAVPEHEQAPAMPVGGNDMSARETAYRTAYTNRYDNGILQADAIIGQIFRTLDRQGYMDNALVVILGDHGEALGEHDSFGHLSLLYQENIHIPLLIVDDEPQRYRNLRFGTQMDVAPTILDRLGLPLPASWRGASLLEPAAERVTLHQTRQRKNPCFAVIRDSGAVAQPESKKYIRCGNEDGEKTEELYDLIADPGEQDNLVDRMDGETLQPFRDAVKDALPGLGS